LIVQQNYFSDLYLAKILDLSAKPFFSYGVLLCWLVYKYHGTNAISIIFVD